MSPSSARCRRRDAFPRAASNSLTSARRTAPRSLAAVLDESETSPDLIARALATTLVATATGVVVGKIFGKRAGFVALLLTVMAHEVLDAPVARRLSKLGI